MRKLAVAMALASTALASPALARDDSWYVGVGAGAMLVEDLDLDIGTFNNAGTLDHRAGYDFEGTVGYDTQGRVDNRFRSAYCPGNVDPPPRGAGPSDRRLNFLSPTTEVRLFGNRLAICSLARNQSGE